MKDMQLFLEESLEAGLREGAFPSACAAIGQGQTVLAKACVGSAPLPGDGPADEHTLYDMASMSKILGPTMLALLALEKGELRLDTRVSEFFDAPEDKREITLYQLMTHTAGFEPSFRLDFLLADPSKAAACILAHPLKNRPGEKPEYSCMGYILLGKLLEAKYGRPLNELARERVFEPLGMTRTGYCPREGVCAATETDPATGRPIIGVVHDENARFLRGVSGNAGVFMPLEDGIRFARMLAAMGGGFLREETMRRAIRNETPGMDAHRGLGFQIAGTPDCFFGPDMPPESFGHTGFTGTSMAVEPKSGFWVVLLTNRVCPTRQNLKLMPLRRALHSGAWKIFEREVSARG